LSRLNRSYFLSVAINAPETTVTVAVCSPAATRLDAVANRKIIHSADFTGREKARGYFSRSRFRSRDRAGRREPSKSRARNRDPGEIKKSRSVDAERFRTFRDTSPAECTRAEIPRGSREQSFSRTREIDYGWRRNRVERSSAPLPRCSAIVR